MGMGLSWRAAIAIVAICAATQMHGQSRACVGWAGITLLLADMLIPPLVGLARSLLACRAGGTR